MGRRGKGGSSAEQKAYVKTRLRVRAEHILENAQLDRAREGQGAEPFVHWPGRDS